jgi:hypothetical protein
LGILVLRSALFGPNCAAFRAILVLKSALLDLIALHFWGFWTR